MHQVTYCLKNGLRNPDAEPDDDDDFDTSGGNVEWIPSAQQLKDLKLAHDNLGHPSNREFARMIKLGNGRPEIVRWVAKHFKCDECQAHKRPKAKRPSAVPRSYRFNHVVGVDLIELRDIEGNPQYWFNSICWGTGQQQVTPVIGGRKTAGNAWKSFVDQWIRVYGLPDVVVCDPGGEFEGHFAEMCQGYGITLLPTDARSPWQNGRTERAGGVWKEIFKKAQRKCPPANQHEHETLGKTCCAVKNRQSKRSGYSPDQRVFGCNHRLPNSLMSDDAIDAGLLNENPYTDFQRAEELRRAALRAYASANSSERIQKALRHQHRIPVSFYEGQWVFVWRQARVGTGRWHAAPISNAEEMYHQQSWAPTQPCGATSDHGTPWPQEHSYHGSWQGYDNWSSQANWRAQQGWSEYSHGQNMSTQGGWSNKGSWSTQPSWSTQEQWQDQEDPRLFGKGVHVPSGSSCQDWQSDGYYSDGGDSSQRQNPEWFDDGVEVEQHLHQLLSDPETSSIQIEKVILKYVQKGRLTYEHRWFNEWIDTELTWRQNREGRLHQANQEETAEAIARRRIRQEINRQQLEAWYSQNASEPSETVSAAAFNEVPESSHPQQGQPLLHEWTENWPDESQQNAEDIAMSVAIADSLNPEGIVTRPELETPRTDSSTPPIPNR